MFGILDFRSHNVYIHNPNPVEDPNNEPSFATGILAGVQIQHALQRCNIFHPPELKAKTSSKLPWVGNIIVVPMNFPFSNTMCM